LKINYLIVNILITAFLVFSLPVCGKKGPPVAPEQKIPPEVNDLNAQISGDRLTLSWTIPEKKDKRVETPSGFIVYRAKDKLDNSFCPNCPLRFTQVSDISLKNKTLKKSAIYVGSLVKGYRYVYKVRAYTKNKTLGKDSNTVQFIYKR